ncbi:glycosyltransferase [Anditalea andensis]|nr:glycosyltransferase [Anditalea andensis]
MKELLSKWNTGKEVGWDRLPAVTLIIPFRNEAAVLSGSLNSIRGILVKEVIFCNDHSDDHSTQIITDYIEKYNLSHWRLINNKGIGKKAVLTTAIRFSRSDIIYTTDADCTLTNKVLESMLAPFRNPAIQMVCGPVSVKLGTTFLEKYQLAEWASITLVSNYFINNNKPLMCSAANMVYRKAAFYKVDGYRGNEYISSGDDEFLLKKIAATYGGDSIRYVNHADALVITLPTTNLSLYLAQRARWTSKWKLHNQFFHVMTAIVFFSIASIQLGSILLVGSSIVYSVFFFVFWLIKIGVDYKVLGNVLKSYHRSLTFYEMISISIFHPLSVFLIGAFSIFVKNRWKGRVVLTNGLICK